MTDEVVILVRELKKSYGSVQALRGVNLEVRQGEIFGFLGPNGAGKTTTIRCFLDLIRPNSGTIRILGLDPQTKPEEVRSRCGYLPGELHLDEGMTVEQTLRFLLRLRGNRTQWSDVRKMAERLDLDLKPAVKNLSKGNKQKVGVVQALMHKPALLLLDEPTMGVDPLIQQEVRRMIVEARQDGMSVFFSSHVISEVQEIADQVAIIREGVIVEVAEPKTLIQRSLRRVDIRFRKPVDSSSLGAIPGVKLLSPASGASVRLQVEGEMEALVKALAAFPVVDLETERPSLEEIFLTYYSSGPAKGG
jgi:ABC-2 type transport system ATP-binding protein